MRVHALSKACVASGSEATPRPSRHLGEGEPGAPVESSRELTIVLRYAVRPTSRGIPPAPRPTRRRAAGPQPTGLRGSTTSTSGHWDVRRPSGLTLGSVSSGASSTPERERWAATSSCSRSRATSVSGTWTLVTTSPSAHTSATSELSSAAARKPTAYRRSIRPGPSLMSDEIQQGVRTLERSNNICRPSQSQRLQTPVTDNSMKCVGQSWAGGRSASLRRERACTSCGVSRACPPSGGRSLAYLR